MEDLFLILVAIAWALGTPLLAIVALARTARLRRENERMAADLAMVKRRLAEASLPPPFAAPEAAAPPALAAPAAEVAAIAVPPADGQSAEETSVGGALPAESPPMDLPPFAPPPLVEPVAVGWEQRLGARASVWVGAVTLALAAVFLVRYSIEEGYLSPEVRVILATLFGFALIGVAERVARGDRRVAQALAAAGVAALYGALFAASSLYDMISKVAAGGGAAALTAFAIGLSLRHGFFVAVLAFVGGFVSPAIVGATTPNTPVLFGYLLAIAAGTLAVIRLRGWWPLGWGVLAGSAAWTLLWMSSLAGGLAWVGAFLVGLAGLFVWATWRRLGEGDRPPLEVAALVWTALGVTGLLIVALILQDEGRQAAGWLALAAHGAGLFVLGRWTPRFQNVAGLAPLLSLAALALWGPADSFGWTAGLLGGFYAVAAFALMWNAARPGAWAALSVGAALGHFLLIWWMLRDGAPGTPWGLISIALALPFLVGVERLMRWRESMPGAAEAVGVLAAGVVFFVAAAIALELRREWITVAYAVEFAAIALIADRLGLRALYRLCWPLLAVVVVRFVFNPELLSYPLGVTPVINWILWGYGLAIASLAVGLRVVRRTGDRWLTAATEASVALLGFALITLETRSLFQPVDMTAPQTGFMERAAYVLAWGAFALAALWWARRHRDPVALWAWRGSGALAAVLAVIGQVMLLNPVFDEAGVGRWPVLNGLLLAYAVPAAMAGLARRWIDVETGWSAAAVTEGVASILAFAYVSFEVRHLFDPGFERPGFAASGVELYAYSAIWLLFGVVLLALGFLRQTVALRHAGMALVCVVVAKVFLVDMAGLQGLLRVFSLLGLGAALVGLGYAYRRFGFR
ncbi:DUF2339 domain-containing protein [Reyranella sp.]|uniref:DUF2339 domain-containing protein n=1 Tax=Reyranella sp. TaxID=1929291 RepID=UPI003BAD1C8B